MTVTNTHQKDKDTAIVQQGMYLFCTGHKVYLIQISQKFQYQEQFCSNCFKNSCHFLELPEEVLKSKNINFSCTKKSLNLSANYHIRQNHFMFLTFLLSPITICMLNWKFEHFFLWDGCHLDALTIQSYVWWIISMAVLIDRRGCYGKTLEITAKPQKKKKT